MPLQLPAQLGNYIANLVGFKRTVPYNPTLHEQVVPVVIVNGGAGIPNLAVNIATPSVIGTGSTGGVSSDPDPGAGPISPVTGLGQPFSWTWPSAGGVDTIAENTGCHHYSVKVIQGWALRIEYVYVTFLSGASPATGNKIYVWAMPYNDPGLTTAINAFNWNDPRLAFLFSKDVTLTAATRYYCQMQRHRSYASTGETNNERIGSGVRTLWFDGQIPDHLIYGGGVFGVSLNTGTTAGDDYSEVSITVHGTAWKV